MLTLAALDSAVFRLTSPAGLSVVVNENGSVRRIDHRDIVVNLFVGNELEGGPANLYLRVGEGDGVPLLGPRSATRFAAASNGRLDGAGACGTIRYRLSLVLAQGAPAWFWHVAVENTGPAAQRIELIHLQDIALAPYGAVRLNEYYVSQYVDHTPLRHGTVGTVVASRQNQAVGGRTPWSLIGSLRRGVAFATDGLQVPGVADRSPMPLAGGQGLPDARLQHEHSMVVLQDEAITIAPGASAALGFFGWLQADHPAATSAADAASVDEALALPEATPPVADPALQGQPPAATLFSTAPTLAAQDLDAAALDTLFGSERRHGEQDDAGRLLSFFHGLDSHVVLAAKERAVRRPHGHLLRTGRAALPDESALTSTVWMAGVFHSMVTQGHVSINRFLSTTHSYLGLFRSHGQRVFVEIDGVWQLLDRPSAFEMTPSGCRWLYRHVGGLIELRSQAHDEPHALGLSIVFREGSPMRCLVSHHVALNGDDGSAPGPTLWALDTQGVTIKPARGGDVRRRFPKGSFRIEAEAGTAIEQVGADELLFLDGRSRHQPFVCLVLAAAPSSGLRLTGHLVAEGSDVPSAAERGKALLPDLRIQPPAGSPLAGPMAQLADIVPWFAHNALIHYLSPRGLEQFSGGGWGTRDVSQGPLELLLAFDCTAPLRDVLLRVMRAQNPDGDWPQWFMFFERERSIRAGDSHGDIVFWPLLALAQYLIATGDASLLDEPVPFFHARRSTRPGRTTVWQHVKRALALIKRRVIAGTSLAAYGHGDWNDALQPADPAMREHMCSAWTVTLHHQMLGTLARALRLIGRDKDAAPLEKQRAAVRRDFQRVLLVDGVLAGYALFDAQGQASLLLHPRDSGTGVRYSVLAMIHAILDDMLSPQQVREHLALIEREMTGPDGVRLFDKPMPYHGGPQRHFQRAESATFFGREIGLMYMHAHLRHAQALAHVGEAERFFHALCQANPIGIRAVVPSATLRQSNCYYSSSDAAFADRYQASDDYARINAGTIALDGGWRVYSSGAGIALSLIVRHLLGLNCEAETLSLDPVMPVALNGLRVSATLRGRSLDVVYEVQGRGCGVKAVRLNGEDLPFVSEPNPYRTGAARVSMAPFLERLAAEGNQLRLAVG